MAILSIDDIRFIRSKKFAGYIEQPKKAKVRKKPDKLRQKQFDSTVPVEIIADLYDDAEGRLRSWVECKTYRGSEGFPY